MEYAFLSDFDLLRDTRINVTERPWANPTSRMLMDRYFKLERAREEIQRLNIEIPRVITYMRDEHEYLARKEREIKQTDPGLAHQVRLYREQRGRYDKLHMERFVKLSRNPKFTASIEPGVSFESTSTASGMDWGEGTGMEMGVQEADGQSGGMDAAEEAIGTAGIMGDTTAETGNFVVDALAGDAAALAHEENAGSKSAIVVDNDEEDGFDEVDEVQEDEDLMDNIFNILHITAD